MSSAAPPPSEAYVNASDVVLSPRRDARLIPYLIVALGALAAALLMSRPALVGIAVPFLLALALGLRVRTPLRVTARASLDAEQVLEGEVVGGRIALRWPGTFDARVALHRPHGVVEDEMGTGAAWEFTRAHGGIDLELAVRAERWGRRSAGEVWLRLSTPGGLLVWTGGVAELPALRVLPAAERLDALLNPPRARAVLGAHRSPRQGEGHEFAALRPYLPGDRLRDLNWRASARHRRPYVNRHHQEVSGDVVIVVDAFGDGSAGSERAIARAARAGWAIASAHLRANDRVGLVVPGGGTRWLPPAGGRRAKYALLEALLAVGGEDGAGESVGQGTGRRSDHGDAAAWDAPAAATSHPVEGGRGVPRPAPRVTLPPGALIVVLTDLHDGRVPEMIQRWRARGRPVAVLMVDDAPAEPGVSAGVATGPGAGEGMGGGLREAGRLARRVWEMEIEGRRRRIAALGVPVVSVGVEGSIAPAVSALRRIGRAPSRRAV